MTEGPASSPAGDLASARASKATAEEQYRAKVLSTFADGPPTPITSCPHANRSKLSLGQAFERDMHDRDRNVFLGGGGAVALQGGPREIKDLDYKMGKKLKDEWGDESKRDGIVADIEEALKKRGYTVEKTNMGDPDYDYVLKMDVTDDLSEEKDRSKREAMEVSVTPTGVYDEAGLARPHEELGVSTAKPDELLLDKAFAFTGRARTDHPKLGTDFQDLVSMAEQSGRSVDPQGVRSRWQAYRKKQLRDPSLAESPGAEMRARAEQLWNDLPPGWERDKRKPDFDRVNRFADDLDASVKELNLLEQDIEFREQRASTPKAEMRRAKDEPKATTVIAKSEAHQAAAAEKKAAQARRKADRALRVANRDASSSAGNGAGETKGDV